MQTKTRKARKAAEAVDHRDQRTDKTKPGYGAYDTTDGRAVLLMVCDTREQAEKVVGSRKACTVDSYCQDGRLIQATYQVRYMA